MTCVTKVTGALLFYLTRATIYSNPDQFCKQECQGQLGPRQGQKKDLLARINIH